MYYVSAMLFGRKKEEWKGRRRDKVVSITFPTELLSKVDEVAKQYGITRSEFIRSAVVEKLNKLGNQT